MRVIYSFFFTSFSFQHSVFVVCVWWRMRATREVRFAGPSLRSLLSPFSIGLSRQVRVTGAFDTSYTRVVATGPISSGTCVALLPDHALCTCQTALDLDKDGMVPPPADMVEVLQENVNQLDHLYLSYFLAVGCYLNPNSWYSKQVNAYITSAMSRSITDPLVAVWERFTHRHVTPPAEVFIAASQYISKASFKKPAYSKEASLEGAVRLCICPVVDLMISRTASPNISLVCSSVKEVQRPDILSCVTGARQGLVSRSDDYVYWMLIAQENIVAGQTLVFPPLPAATLEYEKKT